MAEALLGATGYVLAGGRSSRMGRDKAAMLLNGKTLLESAVHKLRPVCAEVVVIGNGPLGGADRVLTDRHSGCGPIGGIEAALAEVGREWAMFLPVDMPLLPDGLVAALSAAWSRAAAEGARVSMAVAEGVAQPLVSAVHCRALATVEAALARGEHKVRPVLEAAAVALAQSDGMSSDHALCRTEVLGTGGGEGPPPVRVGREMIWQPSAAEWEFRHLWFSNLNTPGEFREAERFGRAIAGC